MEHPSIELDEDSWPFSNLCVESSQNQSVIDMIRVWPCLRLAPTAGVSPPLGKRKHSWHRLQRYNSLSKFDECIDEQNVQKLDGMDIQQFEKTFGYTWLTHLKLLEEDSAFRQQILEMKFYRRLQRRSHIMPNQRKAAQESEAP
eukprot:jgi/Picre1/27864/NNA_000828.t1